MGNPQSELEREKIGVNSCEDSRGAGMHHMCRYADKIAFGLAFVEFEF